MTTSILESVKKMLGIDKDCQAFDTDIIIHINSALMAVTQLGVGPSDGFMVNGYDETWEDLLGDAETIFAACRSYIFLRVRILFDPPSSSYVLSAYEDQIREYEWRLTINHDERRMNDAGNNGIPNGSGP